MPIINSFSGASARGYGFTSGAGGPITLSANPAPSATITTYNDYIVFKFTSTGTLEVSSGAPGAADVLLVGGGSNGAAGAPWPTPGNAGGDGGSGGAIYAISGTSIIGGSPIPVVIGGAGTNTTFGPLTSSSGSQASGGAGGSQAIIPVGTPGSAGTANAYETGSPITYGGSGGGGGSGGAFPPEPYLGNPGGSGGSGGGAGGGRGSRNLPNPVNNYYGDVFSTPGGNGTVNLGGGGGGGGGAGGSYPVGLLQSPGGNGGSGVAIIRVPTAQFETV